MQRNFVTNHKKTEQFSYLDRNCKRTEHNLPKRLTNSHHRFFQKEQQNRQTLAIFHFSLVPRVFIGMQIHCIISLLCSFFSLENPFAQRKKEQQRKRRENRFPFFLLPKLTARTSETISTGKCHFHVAPILVGGRKLAPASVTFSLHPFFSFEFDFIDGFRNLIRSVAPARNKWYK